MIKSLTNDLVYKSTSWALIPGDANYLKSFLFNFNKISISFSIKCLLNFFNSFEINSFNIFWLFLSVKINELLKIFLKSKMFKLLNNVYYSKESAGIAVGPTFKWPSI